MEGGHDWWLQITAALDTVELMVLVMMPAATNSPTVRKEWRYAPQRGVCVCPVKPGGGMDVDFGAMPRWTRDLHFYDLEHEWPEFINDLRTRCERRRVPFTTLALDPTRRLVRLRRESIAALGLQGRGAGLFVDKPSTRR